MSARFFSFDSAWQETAQRSEGRTLFAIGDLHGDADHLDAMLQLLSPLIMEAHVAGRAPLLVCLGDYVDRGPDSLGVLRRVGGLGEALATETVLLEGNHDRYLIDFLAAGRPPPERMERWLASGGQTLLAELDLQVSQAAALADPVLQSEARIRMPQQALDTLAQLQLTHRVGDWLFVHAGIRPDRPLAEQDPWDLVSIREPFLSWREWNRPFRVVHGHTVSAAMMLPHRVSTDTGVLRSGVLSALQIEDSRLRWLCVTDDPSLERFRALPNAQLAPAYGPMRPLD